ncbi:MAG TPA: hypothetical protein VL854_09975 [Nitrososphaeraceae archaeon]|nr:hypothetical protein [Nitrososphaeraceae archaeon]
MPDARSVDADEVKEEPSEFNDDDYEYRSIHHVDAYIHHMRA